MAEIDTPGHGAAWCKGMPDICPSPSCLQPLDPSRNATFATIGAVLGDLSSVLPDEFFHLGGDEADTSCWTTSERISGWMAAKGWGVDSAFNYFTARTQSIAKSLGKQAIVWDEVFSANFLQLDKASVVINTRFNAKQAPERVMVVANATSHGYRVV